MLALTRRVHRVAVRAGTALPHWPPCRARRHRPAALAAVPRRSAAGWPCRRAAVPLSPRRRAIDKAAAGAPAPGERRGRGRRARGAPRAGRRRSPGRARGLRMQAAAAVPDTRAGSACRPRGAACWPPRARAQGRMCWPSPGGGRRRRGAWVGNTDGLARWSLKLLRVFWSFHMMFSHLSASKRVV